MSRFWVDVEDPATGLKLGAGPLTTVQRWQTVQRLDKAGDFSFDVPASDPQTALLQPKRVVRCRTLKDGTVQQIGQGIIDKKSLHAVPNQPAMLTVTGQDMGADLNTRIVGALLISDGAGGPTLDALAPIMALAPTGWELDTDGAVETETPVYYQFAQETVLAAFCKIAELTGEHFFINHNRKIFWLGTTQGASGMRAVTGGTPVALETNRDLCLISDLTTEEDSFDVVTDLYVAGGGTPPAQLTLADATDSAPAGYSYDPGTSIITHDSIVGTYGIIQRPQAWPDLSPDPDAPIAAANQLLAAGLVWLAQHSAPYAAYQIAVVKADRPLLPGWTIEAQYRKWVSGYLTVDVDTIRDGTPLWVLEITTELTAQGMRMTGLQVATVPRYPVGTLDVLAALLKRVAALSSHGQGESTIGALISGVAAASTPEIPSGAINGSNTAYTLAYTPYPNTENVYLNGQRLNVAADYTISGAAITMIVAPATGDALTVVYLKT